MRKIHVNFDVHALSEDMVILFVGCLFWLNFCSFFFNRGLQNVWLQFSFLTSVLEFHVIIGRVCLFSAAKAAAKKNVKHLFFLCADPLKICVALVS